MSTYDSNFFKYVNSGSINSASQLIPLLLQHIQIGSILDVGCGQGAWLSVWEEFGVKKITGIDGDYVNQDDLLIDTDNFITHDLSFPFDLKQQFDLVVSLEVAEHLPGSSAENFIKCLTEHGQLILFSAAPKGQGGDHHVNEQDYDYWRKLFNKYGYSPIDYVRPLINNNLKIEPWYRYNSFLYSSDKNLVALPTVIRDQLIKNEIIDDIAPLWYKIRKRFVYLLPVKIVSCIAKLKKRIV